MINILLASTNELFTEVETFTVEMARSFWVSFFCEVFEKLTSNVLLF